MACVGRTKICSIVPPNHFGPIPGVPVGSSWKFRVQVGLSIYSVFFLTVCCFIRRFESHKFLYKLYSSGTILFLILGE